MNNLSIFTASNDPMTMSIRRAVTSQGSTGGIRGRLFHSEPALLVGFYNEGTNIISYKQIFFSGWKVGAKRKPEQD
jgi:hypothetical protein